jgi:hypothetical protein
VKINIRDPALRTLGRVTEGKQHAAKGPGAAEGGGVDGVLEPGNKQGGEEGGQVLGEVGVGALGYPVISLLLLRNKRREE